MASPGVLILCIKYFTSGPSFPIFLSSFRFGRDPARYVLRLGDYHTEEQDDFERTLSPQRIVIHRKYHSQGWEYDIALLWLKGTEGNCVAFNPHTSPVCLPEPGNKWEKRPAACVITGWGITGTVTSLHVELHPERL